MEGAGGWRSTHGGQSDEAAPVYMRRMICCTDAGVEPTMAKQTSHLLRKQQTRMQKGPYHEGDR